MRTTHQENTVNIYIGQFAITRLIFVLFVFLYSDCLKNAPSILFEHLEFIIKSFLIHGHVSTVLLLATLVPLIKDKLGNMCTSKNYRSIAIRSLLLKIFDWVIILLFGEALMLMLSAYKISLSDTRVRQREIISCEILRSKLARRSGYLLL